MTIWYIRIVCWIPKATNTRSEHVILIVHFNNRCTNAPHCYVIARCLFCLAFVPLTTNTPQPTGDQSELYLCFHDVGLTVAESGSWCHWHVPAPPIRHKWLTPMRQHMDWAHVTPVRESGVCPTRPMTLQSGVSKINQTRNALNRHKRNPVFQPIDNHRLSDSLREKQQGKIILTSKFIPPMYNDVRVTQLTKIW